MTMNMYWPQHKVFFLATLALFPEKLLGKPMVNHFHFYYLGADTDDEMHRRLYEYEREGYLEFERIPLLVIRKEEPDENAEFKPDPDGFLIKTVNSQKAYDDLEEYLQNWHDDKLTTDTAFKPDDYKHQMSKLLRGLSRVYPHQSQPRINIEDIYGDREHNAYQYIPPFWEVVLTPQFIAGKYAISQMDYDLKHEGRPYVQIKLTDQAFERWLELQSKGSEQISELDLKEYSYNGLRALRDGTITYNGELVQLSQQERDVVRVFIKRPEEVRPKEDFTDPESNIFNRSRSDSDLDRKLGKLIPQVHEKLRAVVKEDCIFNVRGLGWKLKLPNK